MGLLLLSCRSYNAWHPPDLEGSLRVREKRRLRPGFLAFLLVLIAGASLALLVPQRSTVDAYPASLVGSWISALALQNRNGGAPATVTVTYYDLNTQSPLFPASQLLTLGASGSTLVNPSDNAALPNGNYAVVVGSDQFMAEAVFLNNGAGMIAGYSSMLPHSTLYFPRAVSNGTDLRAFLYLQNASNSSLSYEVRFHALDGGSLAAVRTGTLSPSASVEVEVPSGEYGVQVTGSGPLVGAALLINGANNRTIAYRAIGTPRPTAYFPLLPAGSNAMLAVQNVDIQQNQVRVRFIRTDTGAQTESGPVSLSPGAVGIFMTPDPTASYSAIATAVRPNNDFGKIAAMAHVFSANSAQGYAAGARGGTVLYFPDFRRNLVGRNSTLAVQNTNHSPASGTVVFFDPNGTPVEQRMFTLDPGRTYLLRAADAVGADGRYSAIVSTNDAKLVYGLVTQSTDAGDQVLSYEAITDGEAAVFADVPPSAWFFAYAEALYDAGITTGCGTAPLSYCPDTLVTRAQIAVFILRTLGVTPPPATGTVFQDVPASYWAAPWIEELYRRGVTSGCATSPLRYCPENNVTRAEMAVLIEKALGRSAATPAGIFADVPPSHWAAGWIEKLYADGITQGCSSSPLRYCPDNAVPRSEMAVFLTRGWSIPP